MSEDLCPICSGTPGECDHELVRWSTYAMEWEECSLLKDAKDLAWAIHVHLRRCALAGVGPDLPQLKQLYRGCFAQLQENDEADSQRPLTEVIEFALDSIAAIPGVLAGIVGVQPCRVLWAKHPERVQDEIRRVTRTYEIKAAAL